MSGTMLYDGQPRGVFDLDEWFAYRAAMEREVAAHPTSAEAREELDFANQQIQLMQRLDAEKRLAA